MKLSPDRRLIGALATAVVLAGCKVPDPPRADRLDVAFLRLAAAEDARPVGGDDLVALTRGTSADEPFLRRVAVRGLGRLENPELVPAITPLLDDPAPAVREAAANALAQAVHTTSGEAALDPLLERLGVEEDPGVRGTLARSIGRLTLSPADRPRALAAILETSRAQGDDAPTETLLGVALGLEALVRAGGGAVLSSDAVRRLRDLARYEGGLAGEANPPRIRALAVTALGRAEQLPPDIVDFALRDTDEQAGATALRYFGSVPATARDELLRRAVANNSLLTVLQAFQVIAAGPRTEGRCAYLFAAAERPPRDGRAIPVPIRLVALDALAEPCPESERQRSLLREVALTLPVGPGWQPAAHGLAALARLDPPEAATILPTHASHPDPFVRAWAARTAGVLGDTTTLRVLSTDEHPNVRTAVLQPLFALVGHEADPLYLIQLREDDPQLLLTAARLLTDSPDRSVAAQAALDAFTRISGAERETWRDPRLALLDLVQATGEPSDTDRLEPFLLDYDATVASRVAEILERWNGRPFLATSIPLPRVALPTPEALDEMKGARVALHMRIGGTIEIALDPYLAITNVARFVRLVDEGYFDGLTFHRWVPNFVIQGGSPGANEYQGDGPYTRDEVGLQPHWRGTVGISTRGHDSGDGQIFVNLMDNVRLDHTYTIIGRVVSGMEVVDRVVEGSVIERAELIPAR